MNIPTPPAALRRLQRVLRIGGAAMMLFFTMAAVAVVLDVRTLIDESGGTLGKLGAWSDHEGHEYILMLAAIYIVWGAFVWRAARDPLANASMIQFTIAGNLSHLGVMALMAITDDTHTTHLAGDVPFGLILPLVLLWAWHPVRTPSSSNSLASRKASHADRDR